MKFSPITDLIFLLLTTFHTKFLFVNQLDFFQVDVLKAVVATDKSSSFLSIAHPKSSIYPLSFTLGNRKFLLFSLHNTGLMSLSCYFCCSILDIRCIFCSVSNLQTIVIHSPHYQPNKSNPIKIITLVNILINWNNTFCVAL